MAKETSKSLRGSMFYQVFVRDYSENGDFRSLTCDLNRIHELGADFIQLLPIHPIGVESRKGSQGSPYAIQDYTSIDPAYGTEKDLLELLDKAHALGMKVLMDVVYNHTSPDSELFKAHPEWFYQKNGRPGNKVGDWWDVIDLDYDKGGDGLKAYLINNLRKWAVFGFDGFRCDVASLVPLDFWIEARRKVAEVKPECIWLAESVHGDFIRLLRSQGFRAQSDSELYQAFDICYEYDVHGRFHDVAFGKGSLRAYIQAVREQEYTFPDNYIKLRFIGNHDFDRPAFLFKNRGVLEAWTAFTFFNKGAVLVYMGDETLTEHRPSLFEKDPIDWSKTDASHVELIRKLTRMKKSRFFTESCFFEVVEDDDRDNIVAFYELDSKRLYGIFNVGACSGEVSLEVPDGKYEGFFTEGLTVKNGKAKMDSRFVVITVDLMRTPT